MRNYEAQFNADPNHFMYGYAARTKKQNSKRRWENSAFALWLQDVEAHCMMSAMEFIRSKEVEPSSLIHDGMLVPISAASLIDCKALGEYFRNATRLKCSFAIKPMTLTDDDLRWKETVVKAFDELQLARQQV